MKAILTRLQDFNAAEHQARHGWHGVRLASFTVRTRNKKIHKKQKYLKNLRQAKKGVARKCSQVAKEISVLKKPSDPHGDDERGREGPRPRRPWFRWAQAGARGSGVRGQGGFL